MAKQERKGLGSLISAGAQFEASITNKTITPPVPPIEPVIVPVETKEPETIIPSTSIIDKKNNNEPEIIVPAPEKKEILQEKKVKVVKSVPYDVIALFNDFKAVPIPEVSVTVSMTVGKKEFLKKVASAGKMLSKKNITSFSLLDNIVSEWIAANQDNVDKLLKYYDKNLEL